MNILNLLLSNLISAKPHPRGKIQSTSDFDTIFTRMLKIPEINYPQERPITVIPEKLVHFHLLLKPPKFTEDPRTIKQHVQLTSVKKPKTLQLKFHFLNKNLEILKNYPAEITRCLPKEKKHSGKHLVKPEEISAEFLIDGSSLLPISTQPTQSIQHLNQTSRKKQKTASKSCHLTIRLPHYKYHQNKTSIGNSSNFNNLTEKAYEYSHYMPHLEQSATPGTITKRRIITNIIQKHINSNISRLSPDLIPKRNPYRPGRNFTKFTHNLPEKLDQQLYTNFQPHHLTENKNPKTNPNRASVFPLKQINASNTQQFLANSIAKFSEISRFNNHPKSKILKPEILKTSIELKKVKHSSTNKQSIIKSPAKQPTHEPATIDQNNKNYHLPLSLESQNHTFQSQPLTNKKNHHQNTVYQPENALHEGTFQGGNQDTSFHFSSNSFNSSGESSTPHNKNLISNHKMEEFYLQFRGDSFKLSVHTQGKILNLNLNFLQNFPINPSIMRDITLMIEDSGFIPGRIVLKQKKERYNPPASSTANRLELKV